MDINISCPTKGLNKSTNSVDVSRIGFVLFVVQASFSLLANVVVLILFSCRWRLLQNSHNRCILGLALTDIFTSIAVISAPRLTLDEEFYRPWINNRLNRELYCRVLWSNYLPFSLGITSLYLVVVLALERWLAVRRSVFYKTRFKPRHMNILIVSAWIVGFAVDSPVLTFFHAVYDHPKETCRYAFPQNKAQLTTLACLMYFFQTILPLALILLAFVDVFRAIKTSLRFAEAARAKNIHCLKRMKRLTLIAALVAFVSIVSWIPSSTPFFVSLLNNEPFLNLGRPLPIVVSFLCFSNTVINPTIYVFSNPELRNVLGRLFSACWK